MPAKVHLVKAVVFPVVTCACESWTIKKTEQWRIDAFELRSPLDSKEIQPVHPKGYQSWIFIGRTDAEAETTILWPPDVKNWPLRKDSDAGNDWRWSPTQWTGVWVSSGSWWWTAWPGVLPSIGLQTIRHQWATELNCYYNTTWSVVGWIHGYGTAGTEDWL